MRIPKTLLRQNFENLPEGLLLHLILQIRVSVNKHSFNKLLLCIMEDSGLLLHVNSKKNKNKKALNSYS